MLTVYALGPNGRITALEDGATALANGAFIWADLHAARDDEAARQAEALIEAALKIDAPTPQERKALEDSARFYEEDGALFLTATLMGQRSDGPFIADAVTFILTRQKLVTVRAITPRAFSVGVSRASARIETVATGPGVLLALLEGVVERIADILQEQSDAAQRSSERVFASGGDLKLKDELRALGSAGVLAARCHDSLSSLHRLAAYAATVCEKYGLPEVRMRAFGRDVQELERKAEGLQNHLAFLLDAALGLVSSEQSNTLKALSLGTIAFVPPTLIASIFGMNFAHMTWFAAPWGPWVGFTLMLAAPIALFAIAKWRKWF
jgi:magnesium transporter